MQNSQTQSLARELAFTHAYQEHENTLPALREIACMRVMFPDWFAPIQEGDWFAGRVNPMLVGITTEGLGYYCDRDALLRVREQPETEKQLQDEIDFLLDFWAGRTTAEKCRVAFPPHLQQGLPSDDFCAGLEISYPLYRIAGLFLDFDLLLRKGIPGLRALISEWENQQKQASPHFYKSLRLSLDIFSETALWYSRHANQAAKESPDTENRRKLEQIAHSLEHVASQPPQTFHQAIQLFWLYVLMAHPLNYGRMDVFLGDFLVNDLEAGRLTREQALDMLVSLWKLIVARGNVFNNRVIVGGRGRRNEPNADFFALLALDAQEIVHDILPMLSLRWYEGMDERIWNRAMDVIAAGNTFPILYNDDVNIPGVAQAFDVPQGEAEQYLMFGCGEYVIGTTSAGTPNGITNLVKALDVTLHNGIESFTGLAQGVQTGDFAIMGSFDDLWAAYARQVEHQVDLLAEAQELIYTVTSQDVCFPLASLLMGDCLERGKPLLNGGVRYLGGTLETYGNNSVADALLAIKKSVFEQGWYPQSELLQMLDNNFVGFESHRRRLKSLPKFGNDDSQADEMSVRVNTQVCATIHNQREKTNLSSYLAVLINNYFSVALGKTTSASADGRLRGEPLSNGNQPSAGCDNQGLTALLNSMSKLDPGLHAGAVHNVKLSGEMMRTHRPETESLIKGYFDNGGTQVMITVVDRGELEEAMRHPEHYGNLIVRIGGYSERFVNLPRDVQLEVIHRTLY